ncbi:MAG: hypothetical protein QGD94_12345, partial [Planctomycetia bacterium]|nr:hypothetical protein [Planctomycetia bacterium]
YELQNVGKKAVKFLPWYTPLEGISGDIFTIVGPDGKKVRYWGIIKQRPLPRARDFLSLAAGGRAIRRVRLLYDFTKPGRYRISVTTQRKAGPDGLEIKLYYGGDAEKAKQNPDNVWRGALKSNMVTVDIVRPGKAAWGKVVNGLQCQFALDKATLGVGEKLRFTFTLRNTSREPIKLLNHFAQSAVGPFVRIVPREPGMKVGPGGILFDSPWPAGEENPTVELKPGKSLSLRGSVVLASPGEWTCQAYYIHKPPYRLARKLRVPGVWNGEVYSQTYKVKVTDNKVAEQSAAWGPVSNGLRCRLYVAPHDPAKTKPIRQLTFEVRNVSGKPITIPTYYNNTLILDVRVKDYPELSTPPSWGKLSIHPYVLQRGQLFAYKVSENYFIAYGRSERGREWVRFDPAGKIYEISVIMESTKGAIEVFED